MTLLVGCTYLGTGKGLMLALQQLGWAPLAVVRGKRWGWGDGSRSLFTQVPAPVPLEEAHLFTAAAVKIRRSQP